MLPSSVRQTLWSYDVNKVDLQKDKRLIIQQVLNYGTKEATDWLFTTYEKDEIAKVAQTISKGTWNKMSLGFWSLILGIKPNERF